ncbi:hypothetical protein CEQ90_08745 [Lewinellaceae bacterium SD302]|nr:hypothetical protein CEQ90_08745 [Lewinellaceae bacterium SD302]
MARLLLTELIEQCTLQECTTIAEWLDSPVHNKKPALQRLFDYFSEQLHHLHLEPEVSAAFKAACPKRPFNQNVWAKLNYELVHQVEDCLAYTQLSNNSWRKRLLVLDAYREKGLSRHLKIRLDGYRRATPKADQAGLDRYRYDDQLEQISYQLETANNRTNKQNLREKESALMRLVLASKFRQFGKTLAHQRVSSNDFTPPLLTELLAYYSANIEREQVGVHLFYLSTLLYLQARDQADATFQELKTGIQENADQFNLLDLRDLLVHAVNYGVRQTNAGRQHFVRETLELYQIGVKQKLFYEHGEIDLFTFNNIIGLSLRLGEIEYAESFIEENAQRLPIEKRGEVASLNRGRLAYQKGNYSQALQHLQTADYQDFIHHMTARVLQLKIYFERDDYNLLISHIRSTKSLLRRKKNLGYHQNNYRNIFTLTDKITRVPPGDRAAKQQLLKLIAQTEPCTEKEWLSTQLSKYES